MLPDFDRSIDVPARTAPHKQPPSTISTAAKWENSFQAHCKPGLRELCQKFEGVTRITGDVVRGSVDRSLEPGAQMHLRRRSRAPNAFPVDVDPMFSVIEIEQHRGVA